MSRGVLVTGASRGVGAEVAKVFAAAGDRVVLHCRGAVDKASAVLAELPGEGHSVVSGDLGDPAGIPALVEESARNLGRINVLVNNAALFVDDPVAGSRRIGHPLADTSYDDWVAAWRRTLAVNLEGAAHLTWCVARQMLDVEPADGVRRGVIVNVGSRGAYRGEPDVPAYGASKAGLHAFGQSMAVALAPHDITVTSIAPGFIATDMAAQGLNGPGGDAVRAQSPFGRVATAPEVAAAVHWLASPEAGWSSGAVLDFNGASYLR
ncbi:SDR family NAD(P)-dependent oxidoreductase [Kribbella sp. CA-293567]|uniref:SDR family NAD(P)-dependent oxidoreductase n=1 Tax=Kribbella sp. CA-293567 TaxID=3002436 RepID=UPI0022DD5E5B|nr:SDR family oxidoreductase [Kribbella sp. CA-293567]WBQ05771.1 SDR family NAD(P)-dependent oxidoreductase [Kribbella sp. CA-293567]